MSGGAQRTAATILLSSSSCPSPACTEVAWRARPTRAAEPQLGPAARLDAVDDAAAPVRDEEAAAIGGAVDNGTGTKPIDWAAYIVTQYPYAAPLPRGRVSRTTGASNISR